MNKLKKAGKFCVSDIELLIHILKYILLQPAKILSKTMIQNLIIIKKYYFNYDQRPNNILLAQPKDW